MTIFKPLTDTGRYMPNSWIRPEEPILSTHDARCDFTPMLVVSVREGVVLNRMAKVLPHKDERSVSFHAP